MKKETVPSYPWRDHLIKENETETIAMQAAGQSRKLHFLIFKISITSDIAQVELNQITLYSDPRASFARYFSFFLPVTAWTIFSVSELQIHLGHIGTIMLQKALRTTLQVQNCYREAHKQEGAFKHGINSEFYVFQHFCRNEGTVHRAV